MDTWSPAWYVDESSHTASALRELASVRAQRARLLPDAIDGYRVGWFPHSGMVFAEGHPEEGALGSPDGLCDALTALCGSLDRFGLPTPGGFSWDAWTGNGYGSQRYAGFAGVRRIDLTANLATESTAEGLAILAGVAAVIRGHGGVKAQVITSSGGSAVETVYMLGRSGKQVLGRWYDKGIESGADRRGRLIRPEDQRRFVKASRRDVAELTTAYARTKFQQRFVPLWRASKGVTVGGPYKTAEKLLQLVQDGTLKPAQAERILGSVLIGDLWDTVEPTRDESGELVQRAPSRATRWRRRREMEEHGVFLADGVIDEVEVDLQQVLEAALESDAWERRG